MMRQERVPLGLILLALLAVKISMIKDEILDLLNYQIAYRDLIAVI